MRRLNRYIAGSVLGATFGVLAVLVGLDALSSVVDEAQDMTEQYGFVDVLSYVALTLPRRIHEFVPFAALIGALIGLGRLASSSELTVIRAAGVSLRQIAWAVMKPALLTAVFGFAVGEYLAPVSEQAAVAQRALAQRSPSQLSGRYGTWNRDGDTYIHAEAVQSGGIIFGVTLLTFDADGHLARSVLADRGSYQGGYWLLENVRLTGLSPERTVTEAATTWRWDTGITPELLVLEVVEFDSLPVQDLWPYAQYMASQGLMSSDIELAFWRKLLQPLAVAGLVLVAMSFIFGPLREGSMGARIFAGVVVGVVFRISQDFFGPASLIFGFAPVLAAITPIAICWLAGLWLLGRRA